MKKQARLHPIQRAKHVILVLVFAITSLIAVSCDDTRIVDNWPSETMVLVAGDATLQIFDMETNSWLDPVGLGLGANWILTDYGDRVFVVNSLSHSLQCFTRSSDGLHQSGTIDLGLERNTNPYAAAVFSKGVAVTNLLTNSVSIVDLDSSRIVEEWPVGVAPEGILSSQDTLYVINTGYDFSDFTFHTGNVYMMDADNGDMLDSLTLGMNPQFGTFVHPDELHIVCTGNYTNVDGEIWILDRHSLQLKEILDIGHSPGRIVIGSYQGEPAAWIAAGGWSNEGDTEGLILSYNTETGDIYDPLSASLGVIDVVVDYESDRLYAVCRDAMKMDVFEGRELIASYDLVDPPNAISIIY